MKTNITKLKITCVTFLSAIALTSLAQNQYPTAKNTSIRLDGGSIILRSPGSAGWARGLSFYDPSGSDRYLAMGLLGNTANASRFYIGFGHGTPWNSTLGLQILANGNVGIGTITPNARLAVNGNILANEIKIKTNIAVPDYVFAPEYQLMPLSTLEKYISEHRHLPEVPSASDVEKNGLDVAEMNLILLKKIEEITLHMINKDKAIEELRNELEQIKKAQLQK